MRLTVRAVPRGGVVKRCHIDVVHRDLYAAIDVAVARAAQRVARALDRGSRAA